MTEKEELAISKSEGDKIRPTKVLRRGKKQNRFQKIIGAIIFRPPFWFIFEIPGKHKYKKLFCILLWGVSLIILKYGLASLNNGISTKPFFVGVINVIYILQVIIFYFLSWRFIWHFFLNPKIMSGTSDMLTSKFKQWINKNAWLNDIIVILCDSGDKIEEDLNNYLEGNAPIIRAIRIVIIGLLGGVEQAVVKFNRFKVNKYYQLTNFSIKIGFIYYSCLFLFAILWWFIWQNIVCCEYLSIGIALKSIFVPSTKEFSFVFLNYLSRLQLIVAVPISFSFGLVFIMNIVEIEKNKFDDFIDYCKTLSLKGSYPRSSVGQD